MKAFTLIELLVVVAIIGILAAVGVTTFGGFQEKAKVSAAKANHKSLVKYITNEVMKCSLGDSTAMEGNLDCSKQGSYWWSTNVSDAAEKALSNFGEKGVVELTSLIGYYCMIAMTLNEHNVPLPNNSSAKIPSTKEKF